MSNFIKETLSNMSNTYNKSLNSTLKDISHNIVNIEFQKLFNSDNYNLQKEKITGNVATELSYNFPKLQEQLSSAISNDSITSGNTYAKKNMTVLNKITTSQVSSLKKTEDNLAKIDKERYATNEELDIQKIENYNRAVGAYAERRNQELLIKKTGIDLNNTQEAYQSKINEQIQIARSLEARLTESNINVDQLTMNINKLNSDLSKSKLPETVSTKPRIGGK